VGEGKGNGVARQRIRDVREYGSRLGGGEYHGRYWGEKNQAAAGVNFKNANCGPARSVIGRRESNGFRGEMGRGGDGRIHLESYTPRGTRTAETT